MHRLPPVALAGLLLVAVAGHGAEAQAPGGALDQTKAELKQLQSDQRNKAGQTGDKLKLGVPTLETQGTDPGSPEAWLSDKLKKDRKLKDQKGGTNKNWLVDGVEKLEKEGSQSKDGTAAVITDQAGQQSDAHVIDQSDPQYLLKLFDEQKKTTDSKASAGKSPAAASPDAFAPFMQSWLSSSPVKGQLMDQFVKKTDNGGLVGGAPVLSGDYRGPAGDPVGGAPVAGHDAVAATKANPYLTDLSSPILTKEVMAEAQPLQSMGAAAATSEAGRGGPVLLPTAPTVDSRERPKGPPPSPADDKKYFPQLKRF